ncbi:hypothetical protein LJB99_01245 [Deltaproteobacteria bacterium OttesenSCG-928-K17]|nr:hypothetical protein [Deltaproteobacteria bacterium OttesenSCG-928-K17]
MGSIIFIIYAAAVLGASFMARRQQQGEAGFFLNNRSSSAWAVGASIVVSCVGASATIGTVGLAFEVGVPAFWWLGSGAVGLSVLALFLAAKVRRTEARTMPEIVEIFFGPQARRLISVIIVAAWLSILAAQFSALSQVTAAMTGLETRAALIWGVILVTIHTVSGGQAGVIRLDRWQCLLLIAGLLLTVGWLAGLNHAVLPAIPIEAVNKQFPAGRLIYFLLIIGGSYVVCPTLFGRLLSAQNEKTARQGALGAALGLVIVSAAVVLIGLLARGLVDPAVGGDAVLVGVLEKVFPGWLTLAVYVVLLSAIVSSADSGLISAGLVLAHDVFGRKDVKASRLCLTALALGGLLLSLSGQGILNYLLMANDIYVCGVVGPVFAGLMWAGNNGDMVPARGLATAGIAAGGLLGLISAMTGNIHYSYAGLLASSGLTVFSLKPLGRAPMITRSVKPPKAPLIQRPH